MNENDVAVKERKNSNSILIVVILGLIILGLVCYIGYDKIINNSTVNSNEENLTEQKEDKVSSKQENSKEYNITDYISVIDFEFNKNCIDCGTYGVVKKIEFKTLPLRTITEFNSKHGEFIYPSAFETAKLSNEVTYEIDKNILSVYTKESKLYEMGTQYNYYSLNVNLNNNKIVTNQELLKIYNVNSSDMYEKILNNISNTVTTDKFLLSTDGDVTAETLTIDKFKENIKLYTSYINNRYDVMTLYIKDNKLTAVYDQSKILSILGMGTHMGIGLLSEPQSILLN